MPTSLPYQVRAVFATEPETYWRSIILFGKNVASYKFALAQSLLELAQTGKTSMFRLGTASRTHAYELAHPFSRHLTKHLLICDKQVTSPSSRFLDKCREFNAGAIAQDELISATVKLGFVNVIDAFHNVNNAELPVRFFTDERRGTTKGVVLTDALLELLGAKRARNEHRYQYRNLPHEVEARWRLVETEWELNLSRNLIAVEYDHDAGLLFPVSDRRKSITSCRSSLNGYQKGKCFYCFADISIDERELFLADVEHFYPRLLRENQIAHPIDGVWNLVLACQTCNRGAGGKFHRMPHRRFLGA